MSGEEERKKEERKSVLTMASYACERVAHANHLDRNLPWQTRWACIKVQTNDSNKSLPLIICDETQIIPRNLTLFRHALSKKVMKVVPWIVDQTLSNFLICKQGS